MPSHRLVPVLAALAVAGCLAATPSVEASTATSYFAGDRSGDLVKVTVTGNRAEATSVIRKGNPETQQLSPAGSDGGVIVGLAADIDAGTTTLFTYDTARRQFHDLSSLGRHIVAAAIYEHGTRIAYSRKTRHAYVIRSVPADGGAPKTLFSSSTWNPWDIAISEDGKHLYCSASEAVSFAGQPNSDTHRSTVFRVAASGRTKLEPDVGAPLFYTQIQLSPDDTELAVVRQRVSGSPRSTFTVVTLSSGNVRTVLKSYANPIAGIAWAADASSLVFRDATGWVRLGLTGRVDAIAKTSSLAAPALAS